MSCRLKPYITKCRCLSLAVATLSLFSREASGVMIVLDYSGDTFFAGNAAARNALEAAAADLSAAITTNLAPVDADVFTGVNGSTSATFDWRLTYPHPATGAAVTIEVPRLAANEVRVFAGARNLGGGTLGIGSTGGAGFGLNGSGFPNQWIGAVDAAEALSNAKLPRGGGPTMGSISGSSNFGGFVGEYSLQYGAMGGSISFDLDTDDDGDTDTPAELGAFWQFDHTAPVVFEKYDFYSVALHELMHALGIGQSVNWSSKVSGLNWLGAQTIALHGTGTGIIASDGAHPIDGLTSLILDGSSSQEVVMSPLLTNGERRELTQLDLTFLRDIGWDTVAIPEPGPTASVLCGVGFLLALRSRPVRRKCG